tara:strand:+ start:403 stop:582 length:180 start_codon:yes stop_codon:yes gene_type:complete
MTKFIVTIRDTRHNEFNVFAIAADAISAISKVSKVAATSKKHAKVRTDPNGYSVTARAA